MFWIVHSEEDHTETTKTIIHKLQIMQHVLHWRLRGYLNIMYTEWNYFTVKKIGN